MLQKWEPDLSPGTVGRLGGATGAGEDEGHRICCRSNWLVSDDGPHLWREQTNADKIHIDINYVVSLWILDVKLGFIFGSKATFFTNGIVEHLVMFETLKVINSPIDYV